MKDAIQLEASKSGKSEAELKEEQKRREAEAAARQAAYEERLRAEKEEKENADKYFEKIKNSFSDASPELKSKAKQILNDAGFDKFSDENIPAVVLKVIAELF